MQTLESLFFFLVVKTTVKFRNLQIRKNLDMNTNFSNSFQGYVHIFQIYIV